MFKKISRKQIPLLVNAHTKELEELQAQMRELSAVLGLSWDGAEFQSVKKTRKSKKNKTEDTLPGDFILLDIGIKK